MRTPARILLLFLAGAAPAIAQVSLTVNHDAALRQAEQLAAAGHAREAMTVYRILLRANTEDADAYQKLVQLADATPLADPEKELETLAKSFPDGTSLRKTAHFLIIYNTAQAFADSRARLLEQAYDSFYKKMKVAGLRPIPLQQRLVAIIFDRHEDYINYAKTTQGFDASEAAGYYSSLTNRIAMFNNQSSPQFKEMAQQIARLESTITDIDGQMTAASRAGDQSSANRLRSQKNQAVSALTQARNGFQRATGLNNIAQTFHEASHQLAYNADIQWMGAAYPFWYSEGLATNFETINPAVPFGPGEPNYPRAYALKQTARKSKLTTLTELATTVELAAGADRADWYGQAWGLFHWLYKTQPAQLRRYRALINQRGGAGSPQTLREDFESAFGPIATLEPQWRQFVYNLK